MIIVEGPDGAGKTTLIEQLLHQLDLPVADRVVSKDAEAMTDLVAWVEDNVKQGWQNVIYDRHRLISEPIYGPILRNRPEPGFDDIRWLTEMTEKLYDSRPVIIYCLPTLTRVWKNILSSDDNKIFHLDADKVGQIYWGYFNRAVYDNAVYDHAWVYDYEHPFPRQVDRIVQYIQQKLNERNAHAGTE